jgi:uncharacterized protein YlxW (UPF0749 family)
MLKGEQEGKPYTVRYDAINAMLLNEFLKEHQKVEEEEATITQLKNEMASVVTRLKEHEAKIQKVSDRIETNKLACRMAGRIRCGGSGPTVVTNDR